MGEWLGASECVYFSFLAWSFETGGRTLDWWFGLNLLIMVSVERCNLAHLWFGKKRGLMRGTGGWEWLFSLNFRNHLFHTRSCLFVLMILLFSCICFDLTMVFQFMYQIPSRFLIALYELF